MALQLVTGPAEEPISLAEAKSHLRVSFADDDPLIQNLIYTAREEAEARTERALCTQTWKLVADSWPALPAFSLSWQGAFDQFQLPLPPLQSVTSIVYKDTAGVPTTLGSSNYIVDTASEPGRVALAYSQAWPGSALQPISGVTVTFVAGYGTAFVVPQSIKQAMLLLIGHWYENREEVVVDNRVASIELPKGAEALLWRYRVPALV